VHSSMGTPQKFFAAASALFVLSALVMLPAQRTTTAEALLAELGERFSANGARVSVPPPPPARERIEGFTFQRVSVRQASTSLSEVVGEVMAAAPERVSLRVTL